MKLRLLLRNTLIICCSLILLTQSVLPPGNELEKLRAFTRQIEFDYVNWTIDALYVKATQAAFNATRLYG